MEYHKPDKRPYVGSKKTYLYDWSVERSFFGVTVVSGYRSDTGEFFRSKLEAWSQDLAYTEDGLVHVPEHLGRWIV